MARSKDEVREERIVMEVVVDAYGRSERAMGWYYYLDGKMKFPFKARCRLSSGPEDFHLRALPEPYVNLSIHTAPIVRPLP